MGFESANYKFAVNNFERNRLSQIVLDLPNVELVSAQENGFSYFEMKTKEFLIELQLFPQKDGESQTVSIRIALCNPNSVLAGLNSIFSTLMEECPGTIFDEYSKKSFNVFDSSVKEMLRLSFLKKKEAFQVSFGEFTAAIRGNEVFEYLRSLKKS